MKETDLYQPVRNLLLTQGFEVKAEIKDIDVLASKDDFFCAVELKKNISLKLIYQAIDRQKTVDQVYVAIPKSQVKVRTSSYKNFAYLLKRLELGLIVVDGEKAEVMLEASIYDMEKSRARYKRRKQNILKEYNLRKNNQNIAGTKGKKLTRYKELVIDIGSYLLEFESASLKDIKEKTKVLKTSSILQKNHDGYFVRISRGIYGLTDKGKEEVKKYINIIEKGELYENS